MEAQANIGLEVAEKLVRYSDNGTSITSVNFPEVALPSHPGKHRLLHIDQNIPGAMSEINQAFAAYAINISGQYLQTNEEVGYVVINVDAAYCDLALRRLHEINGTIRCRVLFGPVVWRGQTPPHGCLPPLVQLTFSRGSADVQRLSGMLSPESFRRRNDMKNSLKALAVGTALAFAS